MSLEAHPFVSDWLSVVDGRFVITSGKVDIGQGISTALCRIVAEELDLDIDEIEVAPVRTGRSPDEGITSGSNSIEQSGRAMRLSSATLREAVLERAAVVLGSHELDLRDGLIIERNSNLTLSLSEVAGRIDPVLRVNRDVQSRNGKPPPSRPPRGMRAMTDGSYRFIQDIARPNMLHARVIRPPHRNARLKKVEQTAIERLQNEGVRIVRDGSFLAVAGEQEYRTVQAADDLKRACHWVDNGGLDETNVFDLLIDSPKISLPVIDAGPVDKPPHNPVEAPTNTARYQRPYQLHGSLAPSAALAELRDGHLSILSHSQGIYPLRESIAEALDRSPETIQITHCPSSGCYGHNGADDAAFEAALIAMTLPSRPILLKWSRQDEHTSEPVAPAMVVDVSARLIDGKIEAWEQQAYSDTHRGRPRPGANRVGPSRFASAQMLDKPEAPFVAEPNMGRHAGLHRNLDPIYSIKDKRLTKNLVSGLPLRTSAMRCLGGAANTFAIESMMGELAAESSVDPLTFRRRHLEDPRAHAVLDAVEHHDFWRTEKPEGFGRGFAYGQYKNAMTRVAVVVDLRVQDSGKVEMDRALLVADAGRVIDPNGLRAQLEGGFIQAASWCLHEKFEYDRSGPNSVDWESYPVIRFDEIPEIETVVLTYPDQPPLGAGEAASGPTLAAIANAVYDATSLRLRQLPFHPETVRDAALGAW